MRIRISPDYGMLVLGRIAPSKQILIQLSSMDPVIAGLKRLRYEQVYPDKV